MRPLPRLLLLTVLVVARSEEHTSELQSQSNLVCRLLLEKKNRPQLIRIIAAGKLIQFWRDDVKLFEMFDDEPYTAGHFAFRTLQTHLHVRRFRMSRLTST